MWDKPQNQFQGALFSLNFLWIPLEISNSSKHESCYLHHKEHPSTIVSQLHPLGSSQLSPQVDNFQQKKLNYASLKGDVEILEGLMREDELTLARVSISSCFNETSLHLASMLGHFDFVKALLCYKPDFTNRLDSQGRSPLHLASANGYVAIVSMLLTENTDACIVRDEDGRTPLHLAVMNGQHESVHELVKAKPEVTQYTLDDGATVLHLCVMYNRLKVLILLIESGAVDDDFINVKDDAGSTILHTATSLKRKQVIKYLITRSEVMVNAINGHGLTALDIIEQMPKDVKTIEIQKLLISAGVIRAKEYEATTSQSIPEVRRVDYCDNSNEIEPSSPATSCINKVKLSRKGLCKRRILKKKEQHIENKGESLLVAATVIAAMAYQAAVSPPGGVIGMDADGDSNSKTKTNAAYTIKPGTSILAYYDPYTSKLFWIFNTISFISSLSLILLFVSGLGTKRKFHIWILRAALWITISSMTVAYLLAVSAFNQAGHNKSNSTFMTTLIAAMTWDGLVLVSFLIIIYRLIYTLRKRFSGNRSEEPVVESRRCTV